MRPDENSCGISERNTGTKSAASLDRGAHGRSCEERDRTEAAAKLGRGERCGSTRMEVVKRHVAQGPLDGRGIEEWRRGRGGTVPSTHAFRNKELGDQVGFAELGGSRCHSVRANTALYFLRDLGKIRAGHELLIIGASGSIGCAAVQLAKHFGATVTAACSGANVELVKTLGADQVIDYTTEDFTTRPDTYDVIFDIVGATTFHHCQRSLKPQGVFLQNIMGLTDIARVLWTSIIGGKKVKGGVATESRERMNFIAGLAASGMLKPVIDRSYPLERVAEAFRYVEQGAQERKCRDYGCALMR